MATYTFYDYNTDKEVECSCPSRDVDEDCPRECYYRLRLL